ncbi:hypothetical protein BGZ63DRAFT_147103 [Mariannaea sp. PMI_226]|nr:hypothetical protein BGZ63DRAFT_147103 [Mariannaea sp. PMI_226]
MEGWLHVISGRGRSCPQCLSKLERTVPRNCVPATYIYPNSDALHDCRHRLVSFIPREHNVDNRLLMSGSSGIINNTALRQRPCSVKGPWNPPLHNSLTSLSTKKVGRSTEHQPKRKKKKKKKKTDHLLTEQLAPFVPTTKHPWRSADPPSSARS